jgi:FtsP/CotA-like multicopper oxidase with cupredoxin domain
MQPGATLTMSWTPERPGNWLFHCHVMTHVSPSLYVDGSPRQVDAHLHHGSAGMTGMVLGITVRGSGTSAGATSGDVAPRRMTLRLRREPRRFGSEPASGFQLVSKKTTSSASDHVPIPGPLLVLKAGEPVEITLVNELPEATAIHWHGMELESYYDGVHGFGGTGLRVTPFIAPGKSFVVRFTPPRRGTFMYHTHVHDRRQLTSGLYGAMLDIGPDETFDAATDHVLVLGRDGPQNESPVVVNGMRAPLLVWRAATRHRIRLINITPDDIVSVSLQSNGKPASWRPLTKDGAAVPARGADARPAHQIIGVGETYDFEYAAAPGRQSLWLEVRSPGGRWHVQGRVILK